MAMSTITDSRRYSLKRRIRQFYDLLNGRSFGRCHKMIDPRVRANSSSVTLFQYQNALTQFVDRFGSIGILDIRITLHLDEPSRLYEERDFAVGETIWADQAGNRHVFSERWVREGRVWYNRSTGFVTPATAKRDGPARVAGRAVNGPRKTR